MDKAALTVEEGQLEEVEDHKEWEEGIEVDVKGVRPLHILTTGRLHYEVPVGQEPTTQHDMIRWINDT